jgi:hypothetical protein
MRPQEFDAMLSDVENEMARLRALYEQYFQGMERVPPVRMRQRLDRIIRRLRRSQPNNTALRFKYQTVFQRWITFTQYWDRISRRIEEGTYARDIKRARRRRSAAAAEPEKPPPSAIEVELDLDADIDAEVGAALDALQSRSEAPGAPAPLDLPDMDLEPHPAPKSKRPPAAKPAAVQKPAPARPPPPPPGRLSASGLGDDDMKRIFDSYVAARKRAGQRPDGVSYEKLRSQIRKMEPKLQKKHGGKRIDFEVVVKDGRVGLKPVAKKK